MDPDLSRPDPDPEFSLNPDLGFLRKKIGIYSRNFFLHIGTVVFIAKSVKEEDLKVKRFGGRSPYATLFAFIFLLYNRYIRS